MATTIKPRKPQLRPLPPPAGSQPALITLAYASAMQAFSRGEADATQQQLVWNWLMKEACAIGKWAYNESTRETDLMLGRQFVGQQIMGLVNANLSVLRRGEQ